MNTLIVLILIFGVYLLVAPGFGIAAFRRLGRQREELAAMRQRLDALTGTVDRLRREIARSREEAEPGAPPRTVVPPAPAPSPRTIETPPPAPPGPRPPVAQPAPPAPPRRAPTGPGGFEERLASRWILWIGAVALALGGAFLVKYAIDEGWLGPAARVALGFLFGCALVIWGEWLRRRPLERAIAALRPDYVPPALTGAGLFIAFASIYAAFALYDLIAPLAAFLLLAALSAGAVFLSLLQGPFTALLGILGGFATPALVPSEQPLAWALFAYLLFLEAAAMVVVRYTAARWLSAMTLAGALIWPALWLAAWWRPGDGAPLGLYLLLLLALFLFAPHREPNGTRRRATLGTLDAASLEPWAAMVAVAILVFALLRMDSYGGASLATLAGFVGLSFLAGRRLPDFDVAPLIAEGLALAGMAAWHLPRLITTTSPFYPYPQGYLAGPIVPPELTTFLSMTIGFAVLLGAGAYTLLWRAERPGWWAAVSATSPVLLLAIAYWRIDAFAVDINWSAAALALAGIEIVAASRIEPRRTGPAMTVSLAAYGAAAVAAIGLGATMALREAWLSVVLALEVTTLTWIATRLRLSVLRPVAAAVAAIVLIRLALNPYVLSYPLGIAPGINWMLYGYGIPAAGFFAAAILFRREADDYLVTLLELGAVAFTALFVTLEIHNLTAGPLTRPRSGLLETGLQSIAWLAIAIGLTLSPRWAGRRAARWARSVLAGLAVLQIGFGQLLFENPLWSGAGVGSLPVLNQLLLAYGIPALLIMAFVWLAGIRRALAQGGAVLALVLVFVELSLEVRRGFHGPVLSGGVTSDAEWYAYSAAWLAYAGALLALGLASGSRALRYASLAVLLVTIGKVFLSDMADLTGLYRVMSFVGLGLSLIGVGYLYQRFVFPPNPPSHREGAA